MRTPDPAPRRELDGTLPFINVVFVVLIFLLMAGTITGTDMRAIRPAVVHDAELGPSPDDAVFLHADGTTRWAGADYDFATLEQRLTAALAGPGKHFMRVYADRDATANDAVALIALIRRSGAGDVVLVAAREAHR